MKKRTKRILLILALALVSGIVYVFTYVPSLSKQHGVVETLLYLGDSDKQPLIVAFGGAEGGIDWHRNHMKGKGTVLFKKAMRFWQSDILMLTEHRKILTEFH